MDKSDIKVHLLRQICNNFYSQYCPSINFPSLRLQLPFSDNICHANLNRLPPSESTLYTLNSEYSLLICILAEDGKRRRRLVINTSSNCRAACLSFIDCNLMPNLFIGVISGIYSYQHLSKWPLSSTLFPPPRFAFETSKVDSWTRVSSNQPSFHLAMGGWPSKKNNIWWSVK